MTLSGWFKFREPFESTLSARYNRLTYEAADRLLPQDFRLVSFFRIERLLIIG